MRTRTDDGFDELLIITMTRREEVIFDDLLIIMMTFQLTPTPPKATRWKPREAPTMLCVAETGTEKKVAVNNHMHEPVETN